MEVEEIRKSQATMTLAEQMRRNQNEAQAIIAVWSATTDAQIMAGLVMRTKELASDLLDEETRHKLEGLLATARSDDPTGYPVDC